MSKVLYSSAGNGKATLTWIVLSDRWFSLTPWTDNGEMIPYFYNVAEKTRDNARVVTTTVGPFAIIVGTIL
jgi:hypothetical protein